VTLSLANEHASLPVAWRLYLPEAWAGDAERRVKAGVPPDITFQTKPRIALDQICAACAAGLPRGLVLAAYDTEFRTGLTALGLIYAVGIQSSTTVWAPTRFRQNPGAARDGDRRGCAGMTITSRFRSRIWPCPCRRCSGGA
jgi:SRSO17 transposase